MEGVQARCRPFVPSGAQKTALAGRIVSPRPTRAVSDRATILTECFRLIAAGRLFAAIARSALAREVMLRNPEESGFRIRAARSPVVAAHVVGKVPCV